jgi:hypothetical protein
MRFKTVREEKFKSLDRLETNGRLNAVSFLAAQANSFGKAQCEWCGFDDFGVVIPQLLIEATLLFRDSTIAEATLDRQSHNFVLPSTEDQFCQNAIQETETRCEISLEWMRIPDHYF